MVRLTLTGPKKIIKKKTFLKKQKKKSSQRNPQHIFDYVAVFADPFLETFTSCLDGIAHLLVAGLAGVFLHNSSVKKKNKKSKFDGFFCGCLFFFQKIKIKK